MRRKSRSGKQIAAESHPAKHPAGEAAWLPRPTRLMPAFATLLVVFGGTVITERVASAASSQMVIIKQMHFEPSDVTVAAGETVEWKNEDIFSHTVTANDGSFDSGPIAPGSS